MDEYMKKLVLEFQNDIVNIEKDNSDIDKILEIIKEQIKENTKKYFKTDDYELKEKIKIDLMRNYNLIYYYQSKKNGIHRAYLLDDDIEHLPIIYLIDQRPERFEIDEDLLKNINIDEGLTIEQARELLKWTANNTRDNLIESEKRIPYIKEDVYGNSSLDGFCGFSQFSSLYPLQNMGFKVTINNVGEVSNSRHAFGTVIIPIKTKDKIVNKRFLIDCTYRQFFTVQYNVVASYLGTFPAAGFFVVQNNDEIEFAKELLKNGFVEASPENLKSYLKPFFLASRRIDEVSKSDEEFDKLDIVDILENSQDKFDYTEEEIVDWGCNLNSPQTKGRNL